MIQATVKRRTHVLWLHCWHEHYVSVIYLPQSQKT